MLRIAMWIGSLFNEKLKQGWVGRKNSFDKVKSTFAENDKIIWMHAASLGEYEQGLPVLLKMKDKYKTHKVLITFFSPSGYEHVKDKDNVADAICYLPFDRKSTMKKFVGLMDVEYFFMVKYDFWYHLLEELKQSGAKTFIVSALFYPSQMFFSSYGKFFVDELKKNIDWIFHQNSSSFNYAEAIGLNRSSISGDTRYDRVRENYLARKEVPYITEFIGEEKCVVFGSSWEEEERIAELLRKEKSCKIIIAPHKLKRVKTLKETIPKSILYSNLVAKEGKVQSRVLIIDNIGLLSSLYAYADVSVVGGGFDVIGLHNILESAVYGNPVLFGDKYENHPEADGLIKANGAKSFSTEEELLKEIINLLQDEKERSEMAKNAKDFIYNQPYASKIILSKLKEL